MSGDEDIARELINGYVRAYLNVNPAASDIYWLAWLKDDPSKAAQAILDGYRMADAPLEATIRAEVTAWIGSLTVERVADYRPTDDQAAIVESARDLLNALHAAMPADHHAHPLTKTARAAVYELMDNVTDLPTIDAMHRRNTRRQTAWDNACQNDTPTGKAAPE